MTETQAPLGERHGLEEVHCREVGINPGFILIVGFEQLHTAGFSSELSAELVEPVPEVRFLLGGRCYERPFESPESVIGVTVFPVLQELLVELHAEETLLDRKSTRLNSSH